MGQQMSIYECERRAKDDGYDTATFTLVGPNGRLNCRWLDAYLGLLEIDGEAGFLMTRDFDGMDLHCENFAANSKGEL